MQVPTGTGAGLRENALVIRSSNLNRGPLIPSGLPSVTGYNFTRDPSHAIQPGLSRQRFDGVLSSRLKESRAALLFSTEYSG